MWMKVGLLPRSATPPRAREAGRRRETLLDFFDDVYVSPAEFLVFDDGYRSRSYSYDQVRGAAYTFAARLRREGIAKGDKIILWGENRPEWIVALWGCLSEGVIVVPVDYRSSADLLRRIQDIVQPRVVVIGDDVKLDSDAGLPMWRMGEIDWSSSEASSESVPIC